MTIKGLTRFFMWCTILNGAILIPNLAYQGHSRYFPLPRQSFDTAISSFLGGYKILIIFFNLVPWLTLLIGG